MDTTTILTRGGFEERFALLVDREANHRHDKRLTALLKRARLNDLDPEKRTPRGLLLCELVEGV